MTIVKWLLIFLMAVVLTSVIAGQLGYLQGKRPTDLGVHDGKLKQPSNTPNSVSSQAALYPTHPQRQYSEIAALAPNGDGNASIAKLKMIIEGTPGAKVIESRPDYLYAQFTSRLFKFVDDVELYFDPVSNTIQVRSASRVGRKDMGANRQRVEFLRSALSASR